jgi:biotin carboxyl carrier protein
MTTPNPARLHLHEVSPEAMGESVAMGAIRLVVTPTAGKLRHLPPAQLHEGHEWVSPGQPVATVERGPQSIEVRSPVEGRVIGFLVRDGEPVQSGQPIVWVEQARSPAGGRS